MRRWGLVALVVLLAAAGVADAKKKNGKKKKKGKDDTDETRNLVESCGESLQGYVRWWRAFGLYGGKDERAKWPGQVVVHRIDASLAPQLRLYTSVLVGDGTGLPTPVTEWDKQIPKVEVLLGRPDQEMKSLVRFKEGAVMKGPDTEEGAEDEGRDVEAEPPTADLAQAKAAELDVVVVAAGHAGFREVKQLETEHRNAVAHLLKALGSEGRINLIWYGAALYTYRTFTGLSNELSRFDEDFQQCELDRLKWVADKDRERKEGEKGPAPPPCGLHEGAGKKIIRALNGPAGRYRGMYSRLLGLSKAGLGVCTEGEQGSTALQLLNVDIEETEERTTDAGAFEEALRMLLRYGTPGHRKVIIVIGDARDGYVRDEATCRQLFTTAPRGTKPYHPPGRYCSQLSVEKGARKKIQDCVQKKLDVRASLMQERFKARAERWLALARAAEIRVYGVAYALVNDDCDSLSRGWERERLELLSQKTGGTYREVLFVEDVQRAAEALSEELLNERVITVDAGLKSEQPYTVMVKATLNLASGKGGTTFLKSSPTYACRAPFIGSGFWWWLKQKSQWLKEKVGTILWWVIVIAIGLLLLLLLWLFLKMVKALVMKVVKAVAGEGKKAAKGVAGAGKAAAKGAAGAGKAAAKGAK